MRRRIEDRGQPELPFGEAEGSFAERKELLGLALLRANASIYESQFMLWLFNVTHGGIHGFLEKSYAELAARPWGLCCHPNQAAAFFLWFSSLTRRVGRVTLHVGRVTRSVWV
jgi:hypothetical protein